ncbi:MAG: sigma-70 family RNA polymerase sigma factor [Myxococcus sp.]|nr:sigma-70 family RNA polymerase sigma factor [Myxococcus sp.]
MSVASDRELSDRLARGDRDALGLLYARHGSTVYAVILKLLRDRAEADEVMQDAFLEAWRRAVQYQPERANVAAWLITIARSRAIDRLRSNGTSQRTAELAGRAPEASSPGPELVVDLVRARAALRLKLEALPVEQRLLIDLSWREGLSHREISAHTGVPLGTVKTRTRAALKTLQHALRALRG